MTSNNLQTKELLELLHKGDLVLFIGAGISQGAGLPSWFELIRPLAEDIVFTPALREGANADDLLNAAQYYENKVSRSSLLQKLNNALDTTMLSPSPVQELIAKLPLNTIYTTNFDDLIEQSLRKEKKRYRAIVSDAELAVTSTDQVKVIKLCGDLQRPESILITKSDFNTFFDTRPSLAARLRTDLESKTSLFLGYSLQDPFFNQIWDRIGLTMGKLRRNGYAVMFNLDEFSADDFKRRDLTVINLRAADGNHNLLLASLLQQFVPDLGKQQIADNNPISKPMSETSTPAPDSPSQFQSIPDTRNLNQVLLRNKMVAMFATAELPILCADITEYLKAGRVVKEDGTPEVVSMDLVGGGTAITGQVLALIQFMDRRGWLGYLLKAVRAARPNIGL